MQSRLTTISGWLRRRAENVAALMLAVMFVAFIAQIVFRYVLNISAGWTSELTLIMWLWVVLWGAAFVVTEREEIRFDIVYGGVPNRVRRILAILFSLALIVIYGFSLPAVVDYVAFMKVQSTAYLDVRYDWLFSIYVVFAVAVILRYFWLIIAALRGGEPEEFDPTKASSGV